MYVPGARKIIYSFDVVFDENVPSTLAYKLQLYVEAIYVRLDVSYTSYATSSREQTGNIIMFAQFEEVNLLSETCDDTESGNGSDEDSNMTPLISEEEMDVMSSGNQSYSGPMSREML